MDHQHLDDFEDDFVRLAAACKICWVFPCLGGTLLLRGGESWDECRQFMFGSDPAER